MGEKFKRRATTSNHKHVGFYLEPLLNELSSGSKKGTIVN
jgi:hypothetical protein